MNTAELERELKKKGWLIHHGANHDQATNPEYPGKKVSIPRSSKDLPPRTLGKIKKATGL
jgi:predicted RNA binding protein YcfA (HicA-like mRNA interferase family)